MSAPRRGADHGLALGQRAEAVVSMADDQRVEEWAVVHGQERVVVVEFPHAEAPDQSARSGMVGVEVSGMEVNTARAMDLVTKMLGQAREADIIADFDECPGVPRFDVETIDGAWIQIEVIGGVS
jgi:hypothetical protein